MGHLEQNHRTLTSYRQGHLDDAGSVLKVCPLVHLIQYCLYDQIEKNGMGGACSTYEGEETCIQDLGGET